MVNNPLRMRFKGFTGSESICMGVLHITIHWIQITKIPYTVIQCTYLRLLRGRICSSIANILLTKTITGAPSSELQLRNAAERECFTIKERIKKWFMVWRAASSYGSARGKFGEQHRRVCLYDLLAFPTNSIIPSIYRRTFYQFTDKSPSPFYWLVFCYAPPPPPPPPHTHTNTLIPHEPTHQPPFNSLVCSGRDSNVLNPLHINFSTLSEFMSTADGSFSTTIWRTVLDSGNHCWKMACKWALVSLCRESRAEILRFNEATIFSMRSLSLKRRRIAARHEGKIALTKKCYNLFAGYCTFLSLTLTIRLPYTPYSRETVTLFLFFFCYYM